MVDVAESYTTEEETDRKRLVDLMESENIAEMLDDDELSVIGSQVCDGFDEDDSSRGERKEQWERAKKLAMQAVEEKSHPWPGSSNVKYPLMTTAAIQFNARAYPAIVQTGNTVKAKIIGRDPDGLKAIKANTATEYMNWQLIDEITEWEETMDRLLVMLPIYGTMFRKMWFDPVKGRTTVKTLSPNELVINANAKCIEDAKRISEIFEMTQNRMIERIRSGLWLPINLQVDDDSEYDTEDDDLDGSIIEQHTGIERGL